MLNNPDYEQGRDLLLEQILPVDTEKVPLSDCPGRILAQDLTAREAVPAFDRSHYDGYAVLASDTEGASHQKPVTLRILEEVAAGMVPAKRVEPGTAAKVLTGAPIPEGADAVVMFEKQCLQRERSHCQSR